VRRAAQTSPLPNRLGVSVKRLPRLAVASVVLVLLLAACGSSAKHPASPHPTRPANCNDGNDSVGPDVSPLVQLRKPAQPHAQTITQPAHLPCRSRLSIDQHGAATAKFGSTAWCQLAQDQPDHKVAQLLTHDPPSALLRLGEGRLTCTIAPHGASTVVALCGLGTLSATGTVQGKATCDPEPVFGVAVYRGQLDVTDPNDEPFDLRAGQTLISEFANGEWHSRMRPAAFTQSEEELFALQARRLSVEVPPPTTASTTTSTTSPTTTTTTTTTTTIPPIG
jgi:hypothetical protein